MIVLIVDDEKHVRNSIRLLADWKKYGINRILEAENGSQAIEMIQQEQPQLVITDIMMPIKNGIELMEWMMTHTPNSKKIVISGHNDFVYVRHTMKYGGVDYLLKPIDKKQLDEAIRKATEQWKEVNQERMQLQDRNMEVNLLKPLYRDKLLSGLLVSTYPSASTKVGLFREFPRLKHAIDFRVAIIKFDIVERIIREKYAFDMELLLFTSINISNDYLISEDKGVAFLNWNSQYEIVILLWSSLEEAETLLQEIDSGIFQTLKTHFDIGLSSLITTLNLNKVHDGYLKADWALRQRNLMDRKTHIHVYGPETMLRLSTLRFSDFEENIRLSILSGNSEQIEAAVKSWFAVILEMGKITIGQLELWWDEYNVIKARWTEELLKESVYEQFLPLESSHFVVPLDEEGEFSLQLLQQELTKDLVHLSRFLLSRLTKSLNVMREIARYIEDNYNRDITLQDISKQFHLNREHISRKFKQEFQENIVDFHNRIRIEKAKILLLNPQIKIVDVSQMVGYKDEKYFSRVFKKLVNQSPKEYRKQSGLNC